MKDYIILYGTMVNIVLTHKKRDPDTGTLILYGYDYDKFLESEKSKFI